mgnify:CR=1 FL=1
MRHKTLEFALIVEVDRSAVQQVKEAVAGAVAERPSLAERLATLLKERLSEAGVADDVTVKLDYRRTLGQGGALRGGLNPDEWSLD